MYYKKFIALKKNVNGLYVKVDEVILSKNYSKKDYVNSLIKGNIEFDKIKVI